MESIWFFLAGIFTAAACASAILKMDDKLQCFFWNVATAMLWGYVACGN